MRKLITVLALVNVCLLSIVASMAYLAETYPLHPGDSFYRVQHSSEQLRLRMVTNPARGADFSVELAERRLADLAMAKDEAAVSASVQAFDAALNKAIRSLDATAAEQQPDNYAALTDLVRQADVVFASLDDPTGVLEAIHEKLHAIMSVESQDKMQEIVPQEITMPTRIAGAVISFLGKDIEHEDFPLTFGHAGLECNQCHSDGEYVNTPVECSSCHPAPVAPQPDFYAQVYDPIPAQVYADHLEGECSDCHDTTGWYPSEFEHEGISECRSCHNDDLPEPVLNAQSPLSMYVSFNPKAAASFLQEGAHYPGDCALCHTETESWEEIAYEHVEGEACLSCHAAETPGAHFPGSCVSCHEDTEDWSIASAEHNQAGSCISCHMDDFPYDHYAGQCADCHTSLNWTEAVFNHSNYYDCRSCHIKPSHHFSGQCSECHDPVGWEVYTFDHSGQANCTACHDSPVDHYSGQCSKCHTTRAWDQTKIDHSEFASCSSCHDSEVPGGHYVDSCSLCHSVQEWADAEFSHDGASVCADCHKAPSEHYGGSCSNCHNTSSWANASFDHSGYTDCLSCHTQAAGHYTGQCSNCHNTNAWEQTSFDHTGYTDCLVCHTPPVDHYLGQCSNCHSTQNWEVNDFDHSGLIDCVACHTAAADHYPGQCSDCHTTASWVNIIFSHIDADNCTGCHAAPSGHWPGQCSSCHETDSWENIHFDHTSYTNCKSCHVRPAGHSRGQCSNCHTTDSWIIPTETPEALDSFMPWLRTTPPPDDSLAPGQRIQETETPKDAPTQRETSSNDDDSDMPTTRP